MPTERIRLLGVPVDPVTTEEAVARVAAAIAGGCPKSVLVVNANKAWQARRDAELRDMLEGADLAVAEWAMSWAARRLGAAPVHHVGGITLMLRLLHEAEARGWSVYLLGARPDVLARAKSAVQRARPGLRVVGAHHGYLDGPGRRDVLAELRELRPDLLFVAMGSPVQERFIAELPADGGPLVRMGVGGSFDVLAGERRRAPAWARGRGLEWLYRMAQDPVRLGRRYLVTNTWFVWNVARERLRGTRAGPGVQ